MAQWLDAMSMLEVLQSYPYQNKSLLTCLGGVDPSDYCLIFFPIDMLEHPPLTPSITF